MNNERLIEKWLSGKLTDVEQKAFEKTEDYNLNKKIIESARHFKAPSFSPEKGFDALKIRMKRKETPVLKLHSYKLLIRIAAIFLIFFSFFALYRYNSFSTVETLASQKTVFELPDKSVATLNSMSKISYSKYKWKNKRTVKLEGEAFFVVAKGSRFDVLTSGGTVSVLGTQFNVKNRENYFEVKCFEGIVSVNNNGKIQQLTKGETYREINNIITLESTKNSNPNWLTNISSFKSVPLYEVLNELERQYNVNITTQKIDTNRLFTGGFTHDDLEQALIAITIPFGLTFEINNFNKITISHSE